MDCADRDRIDEARQELHRWPKLLKIVFFFLILSCNFFKAPVTKVPKACTSVSAISLIFRIINDREMRDAIILIFANKQDLPEGEAFLTYFGSSVCFEKKLSPRNHTIFHD